MPQVYRVKQRAAWLTNRYGIFEPDGETLLYQLERESFWDAGFTMRDANENEVLRITREGIFFHTYRIQSPEGTELAVVENGGGLFTKTLSLNDGDSQIDVNGAFLSNEFTFEQGPVQIATVSKTAWSWSDSYGVEISDYGKPLVILATVAIIDLVFFEDRGSSSSDS